MLNNTRLPPFGLELSLYNKFSVDPTTRKLIKSSSRNGPKPSTPSSLPGQPQIPLDSPHLAQHLINELTTSYLDSFAPYLWLVAKQTHSHISSLTHQIVRGRTLVITEDPRLHLLWYHDRIFIKPIPPYLLSYIFWDYYLLSTTSPIPEAQREQILKAARGYLRSWYYLIQHKSDFQLATATGQVQLIPKNITYGNFIRFISACNDNISDSDVSPRYHFGELRASRINFWGQVLLKRFSYHKAAGQYSDHFSRYFGIILFFFAFFSTALSAMQVALQAMSTNDAAGSQFGKSWNTVLLVSGWFSVLVLIFVVSVLVFLALKFVFMFMRELVYALRDLWRKRGMRKV